MKREYEPSESARMLHGLAEAAKQIQREEFEKIVGSEVGDTLQRVLFAEDWFIWIRDSEKVRRYNTERWSEWLDYPTNDWNDPVPVAVMIQFCKDHTFKYESRDDGTLITPEDFLAGRF